LFDRPLRFILAGLLLLALVPAGSDEPHYPYVREWVAMLPHALVFGGPQAFNPLQGEAAGARLLCRGTEAAAWHDLDAWAEAVLWNREARNVWHIARRFTGGTRAEMVRRYVERVGVHDCPTLDAIEAAAGTEQELAVMPPLFGDPALLAAQDRRILAFVREGGRVSDYAAGSH
jgi:hypothetical protein